MTSSSEHDETGTFRVDVSTKSAQRLQAIEHSMREVNREFANLRKEGALTDKDQTTSASARGAERMFIQGSFGMGKTLGLRKRISGNVELVVIAADDEQEYAIARTEQHRDRDRFDVDLNVSLTGLDEYEAKAVQGVLTHLRSMVAIARQENSAHRITQLLQAIAPPDPLADVQLKVAEASAALRREFLEEVPVLTSAEVHANAGFPGGNPSQTVHRWRKAGKIFAINHAGRDLYPAFQFGQDGRPLPIIAELLEILKRDVERTDWDNALWFAGDTGWLDGKTPIECLQSDPDAVKRAAEQEVLRDEY